MAAKIAGIEALYDAGSYAEGLEQVGKLLVQTPDVALLHFHQGRLLQATGDFAAAEAAFARTVALNPAHYPSYRALGDLARQRGAAAEAREHYQRCVDGLPKHAGCRFGLALAAIDLGELEVAAEPLASAAAELDRADVWAELGQLERRRRRYPESIDAYAQALAQDRFHLPTLLGMGQTLMASGRRDEGQRLLERHRAEAAREDEIKALRRAADQPGSRPEILLQLAGVYRNRGDLDAQEAALREALERASGLPPAVLALANHLLHAGEAEEAASLVDRLPPELASDPAIEFLRGTVAVARRDEATALEHFERSRARGDWPPPVYLDAGSAWQRAGFPERACTAYQQAVARLPGSASGHLGLARCRHALGESKPALASVLRALELGSSDGQASLLLGILEAERGDEAAAKRAFTAGLQARQVELLAAGGPGRLRREIEQIASTPVVLAAFDAVLAGASAEAP